MKASKVKGRTPHLILEMKRERNLRLVSELDHTASKHGVTVDTDADDSRV